MKNETKVIFRSYQHGEIIALFPDEKADHNGNILSYMRIGQHSAASPEYIDELPAPLRREALPLKNELETQVGYVLNDATEYETVYRDKSNSSSVSFFELHDGTTLSVADVVHHFYAAGAWATHVDENDSAYIETFDYVEDYDYTIHKHTARLAYARVLKFLRAVNRQKLTFDGYVLGGHSLASMIGHDLFLKGAGHGVGFWDRGLEYGDELTELAEKYFAGCADALLDSDLSFYILD